VKLSVSLPEDDVEFLDTYAQREGCTSRSAVVHRAVGMLRASELGSAYEQAWAEWATNDDSAAWDTTSVDGLTDATG
jgi:Arc/MetJ-type ribon-helix-helix transcriptional regulator